MAFVKKRKRIDKIPISNLASPRAILDGLEAEIIRNELRDPSLDVYAVARSAGIQINYRSDWEDDLSGVIEKIGGKFIITINSNHHSNRQRFTIAHEIGHFYLHMQDGDEHKFMDRALFRDGKSNRLEWQANDFACRLLMPEKLFKYYISSVGANTRKLAQFFGVSILALQIRAKTLGVKLEN